MYIQALKDKKFTWESLSEELAHLTRRSVTANQAGGHDGARNSNVGSGSFLGYDPNPTLPSYSKISVPIFPKEPCMYFIWLPCTVHVFRFFCGY